MEVVIDSNSINNLLCSLQLSKVGRKGDYYKVYKTRLDPYLQEGRLTLIADEDHALIDEWGRTCGEGHIEVLITHWEGIAALSFIKPKSKIPFHIARKLSFMDSIDRLVIRISMATKDKVVVSKDKHFWDPACPDKRGDPNACIAKLCRDHLKITILLLGTLFDKLKEN